MCLSFDTSPSFHEGKLPFPAAETDLNIGGVRLKKGLHHLPKRV